jgi:DNA-binding CsgD family transcriptional regulator
MLDSGTFLQLNDTIASFYDASLGHVSWEESLHKASTVMKTHNAVFSVRDPVTRKAHFSFGNFGTNSKFVENFAKTYATLSPFVIATAVSPEGVAVNPIDLIGREDYERGRFFKEWSEPQGYHDYIGSILLRQPNAIYTLALGRTKNQPLFNKNDMQKLEFLTPHVTRALQFSERLNTFATEKAELLSTLDALSSPIIVVDRTLRIRQINSAAIALIETDNGISNQNGKMQFSNSMTETEFRKSCAAELGAGAILSSKLKNGMQINVLAHNINRNANYSHEKDDRILVIFDWPKKQIIPIGVELRDRYGLTIAELRVLMMVVDGGTIKSIAIDLGLATTTIKSHVQRLFEKTGTNRQIDLIRKIAGGENVGAPILPIKLISQ